MTHRTLRLVEPKKCVPPHRITHPTKTQEIWMSMRRNGWFGEALVGYPEFKTDCIQLLSGTHRWAAAYKLGLKLPVMVIPRDQIWDAYGDLEAWQELMRLGRTNIHG